MDLHVVSSRTFAGADNLEKRSNSNTEKLENCQSFKNSIFSIFAVLVTKVGEETLVTERKYQIEE